MNALTPSKPIEKPTFPVLSLELRALLDSEPNAEAAVNRIARTPALRAEAVAALPALRTLATTPAGEEGVRDIVGQRFAVFPQPQRSPAEWAMWWVDYYEALADLPRISLEAGMQIWVRTSTSQFLPKPGQLRALAIEAPTSGHRALARVRAVAAMEADRCAEPTPEERAAVGAMVTELAATMSAKAAMKPKPPEPPPVQAHVDETGVSEALRALVRKQRGEDDA